MMYINTCIIHVYMHVLTSDYAPFANNKAYVMSSYSKNAYVFIIKLIFKYAQMTYI